MFAQASRLVFSPVCAETEAGGSPSSEEEVPPTHPPASCRAARAAGRAQRVATAPEEAALTPHMPALHQQGHRSFPALRVCVRPALPSEEGGNREAVGEGATPGPLSVHCTQHGAGTGPWGRGASQQGMGHSGSHWRQPLEKAGGRAWPRRVMKGGDVQCHRA